MRMQPPTNGFYYTLDELDELADRLCEQAASLPKPMRRRWLQTALAGHQGRNNRPERKTPKRTSGVLQIRVGHE